MTSTENFENFSVHHKKVVLDGKEITEEDLRKKILEMENVKNKKIIEVSPGVYKTLQRIMG